MSIYDNEDEYICEFKGCYEKVVQFLDGKQWCARHRKPVKVVQSKLLQKRQMTREEAEERTAIEKFWHYSKAHGVNEVIQPESLEDRFFSPEEEMFFLDYEIDMEIWRDAGY